MDKIYYDDTTYIWKTKLNFAKHKKSLIQIAKNLMQNPDGKKWDGYEYKSETENINFIGDLLIQNTFDDIVQMGINLCKELCKETSTQYNKLNYEAWVNVVRSKKPKQNAFINNKLKDIDKYHSHTELNEKRKIHLF